MPKAHIKSASGAQITIEGTTTEIASIISSIEGAPSPRKSPKIRSRNKEQATEEKKRSSASELVIELKENGFFEKPKGLGDISTALEEQGYLYPLTTLSGVVLSLVQKRYLRRKKVDGRWTYGK